MYQEEIFSNAITDAKRECYDELKLELKGMEAVIENFFNRIFQTSSCRAERDYNMPLM